MSVISGIKTTLPAIPSVNLQDRQLQRFCDAVTQFCAIHGGKVGTGLDRAVTVREMLDSGFAKESFGGNGLHITPEVPDVPEGDDFVIDQPTVPTGFRVFSGTTAVLLVWDNPDFSGAGSTIIYRASTDNFSQAVVLATTPAAVYSDITDNSEEFYYWIRHTNMNGDKGPLNDASGTQGQAGLLTTNADGDIMLASELVAFAIYSTYLTAVHIRGGDMDFAGGRFTVDENGNCTASSITINYGGWARSSNYQSGVQGWAINGDGSAEFNDGTFRGDVYADSGVFNGTVYAEDGYFKGTVYAGQIEGDIVSAIQKNTFTRTDSSTVNQNVWIDFAEISIKHSRDYERVLIVQPLDEVSFYSRGITATTGKVDYEYQIKDKSSGKVYFTYKDSRTIRDGVGVTPPYEIYFDLPKEFIQIPSGTAPITFLIQVRCTSRHMSSIFIDRQAMLVELFKNSDELS